MRGTVNNGGIVDHHFFTFHTIVTVIPAFEDILLTILKMEQRYVNNVYTKANITLGFLRRILNISSISVNKQGYTYHWSMLVLSRISAKGEIDEIVMVQLRAARFVTNRHRNISSVGNMLQLLN